MPRIAVPMSADEITEQLTDVENLSDFAWVLGDWNELANWLHALGAPTETEQGILPTSIERVKWVIEHVEKATLIGD